MGLKKGRWFVSGSGSDGGDVATYIGYLWSESSMGEELGGDGIMTENVAE